MPQLTWDEIQSNLDELGDNDKASEAFVESLGDTYYAAHLDKIADVLYYYEIPQLNGTSAVDDLRHAANLIREKAGVPTVESFDGMLIARL